MNFVTKLRISRVITFDNADLLNLFVACLCNQVQVIVFLGQRSVKCRVASLIGLLKFYALWFCVRHETHPSDPEQHPQPLTQAPL